MPDQLFDKMMALATIPWYLGDSPSRGAFKKYGIILELSPNVGGLHPHPFENPSLKKNLGVFVNFVSFLSDFRVI